MESNCCPSAYQPNEAKPAHNSVCYFRMHCSKIGLKSLFIYLRAPVINKLSLFNVYALISFVQCNVT